MLTALLSVRFRFRISIWVPDGTLESIEMVRLGLGLGLVFGLDPVVG